MSGSHVLALALLAAGAGVVVMSSLEGATSRSPYARLHFLTPITSLGGPLVGLSLAIANGWGLTTGFILLIVALLALTGPVLEAATGRVAAERKGEVRPESPE
jgi:multisubunit Na+/H+ antiporter MnhG subunit